MIIAKNSFCIFRLLGINNEIRAIFKREFKAYFASPLGYLFMVIFLFAVGYAAFEPGRGSFFLMRRADLMSLFQYIPWVYLFLIPSVSMKLISEERRSGTIELLLTLPITESQVIIGKLLAAFMFVCLSLLGTFPMVFTVIYLGSPDLMVICVGYLGALLLALSFLSIGIFFSTLTKSQVISFILSVVVCYLFMMSGSPPILEFVSMILPNYFVDVFESMSMMNHFESMMLGVFRLSDLLYYLIMIIFWSYGSILLLREKKSS